MKDLTKGSEIGVILRFSAPMIIGYFFQQGYQLGDMYVLGRLIGKNALAASGADFAPLFFMLSMIIGFTSANTILSSQLFGAGQKHKLQNILYVSLIVSVVLGGILTVVGILSIRPVLSLMSLPPQVFKLAVLYFDVLMYGTIFIFGYNNIAAIFRGLGDSTTPVVLSILSNILNLSMDFIFVKDFHLGVAGVALATVLAYIAVFIVAVFLIFRKFRRNDLISHKIRFNTSCFKRLFKLGLPSSFQMSIVSIAFYFIYMFVSAFGKNVLAAFAATGRINSLAISPAIILGTALTAFTGQNFGAGKCKRIIRGTVKLGVVAGLVAVLLSSLIYIFSAGLVGLFTKDSNVIAIGKSYLVVVSPFYIMFYMLQIFIGLIRGLGDTLRPMYISWFNTFGVRIPVAFFSGFRVRLNNFKIIPHNYKGIWYGEPVAWTLGLALTVYIFLSRFRGKLQKCTLNS